MEGCTRWGHKRAADALAVCCLRCLRAMTHWQQRRPGRRQGCPAQLSAQRPSARSRPLGPTQPCPAPACILVCSCCLVTSRGSPRTKTVAPSTASRGRFSPCWPPSPPSSPPAAAAVALPSGLAFSLRSSRSKAACCAVVRCWSARRLNMSPLGPSSSSSPPLGAPSSSLSDPDPPSPSLSPAGAALAALPALPAVPAAPPPRMSSITECSMSRSCSGSRSCAASSSLSWPCGPGPRMRLSVCVVVVVVCGVWACGYGCAVTVVGAWGCYRAPSRQKNTRRCCQARCGQRCVWSS